MSVRPISVLLIALLASPAPARPAYKIVRVDAAGRNLLKEDAWRAMNGSTRSNGLFSCENGSDGGVEHGFSQTVMLNQATPQPIVATAWSRARAGTDRNCEKCKELSTAVRLGA